LLGGVQPRPFPGKKAPFVRNEKSTELTFRIFAI
jgi:hypothetical protein